ncbi:MAG TPA: lysyl oxidase family protein [Saprospiraceae bacterium]|nr:lysyl oxidase family protein [Saprospiraceae bacterium]HMQ82350.1 lysyl oxidase family protein [Saprospiraceae bacterium]
MKFFYTLVFSMLFAFHLMAQPPCDSGYISVVVEIRTDSWGYESAWSLTGADGTVFHEVDFNTYASHTLYQTQVCVPDEACTSFLLRDSYGDGIIGAGFYRLIVDGDTILNNVEFGYNISANFNCQPGQTCESAMVVTQGVHTTTFDDHWYVFVPDSTGTYSITTCGYTDCNTEIWVYDTCEGITVAENNQSTVFYNDDESDCAPQAVVTAFFAEGLAYYIRIGDADDACPDMLDWALVYLGPVVGCTDPSSCNYNPLATVDDGSCLPQGDPDCPAAPDLTIRQDVLINSISLSTIMANDACLIEEGCLQGYGLRDIIRFTTWIDNIGELDYYIGQPSTGNTQFTWDNCHNHFHYDGYAEYILFAPDGTEIPVGFKNGFCVLDLGCDWGVGQYGCGNMGITAGCHDIYGSGLECQWIDITDVPDGDYTFVTRVNWDNAPDKLGRVERDTLNNWAQTCIKLDRSSGTLQIDIIEDCQPYVDCAGVPYGNGQLDCAGNCGGTALMGDVDQNSVQEILDAETYVSLMMSNEIEASTCNDLNADGDITLFDAALLASCINYGNAHPHDGSAIHDHCNFPDGVTNINDTVYFSILEVNFDEQYVDVGLRNPVDKINAYHFEMSGINITHVDNLVDPAIYPINPIGSMQQVLGISYQDSLIEKSAEAQPLCRVYFSEITGDFICIAQAIEAVNHYPEKVIVQVEGGCVEYVPESTSQVGGALQVQVFPNPFQDRTRLSFNNRNGQTFQLDITTLDGKVVRSYSNINQNEVWVNSEGWPEGVYLFKLTSEKNTASGRLVVQR